MRDYTIEQFEQEFAASQKIPVFEIQVIDKRTGDPDWVTFDISINTKKSLIKAQHIGLTQAEEDSDLVAFQSIDFDSSYTLDEHLQELYAECYNAITNSEFYQHYEPS